ncbi:MAG: PIN domain-containing protein [Symbiobacteriia bacterium]
MRRTLTLVGMLGGFLVTFLSPETWSFGFAFARWEYVGIVAVGTLLGGLAGFFVAPLVAWAEQRLHKTPVQDIIYGAIGLIVGLIIANLLILALSRVPLLGGIAAALITLIAVYLGMSVAAKKREEMSGLFAWLPKSIRDRDKLSRTEGAAQPKILDTSVIIDGRIADILQTGFIEGALIIPGFVLEELRHIADSSDALKRNRGRRGLDILNKIQKELALPVQIYDKDPGRELEVDSKLVKLAKIMNGKVITNDYNLNKVAELQGVPVLNINELANAIKPVVLPGEEMVAYIVKDGKEPGQGVAYLDDGTMVVVDGGRRHIGETIGVVVTSVLQTSAGRMIFARLKANGEKVMSPAERVAP